MFDSLKNFIKGKKFQESGFARLCKEDGIALREFTLEEMQNVEFANFASKLDRAGMFPKGYGYAPLSVDVVATGASEDKVNYVNIVYGAKEGADILKVNIKNFNVTTAKNDSLVYQYNKGMSKVWMDMCYAMLWCNQFVHKQPYAKDDIESKDDREISE